MLHFIFVVLHVSSALHALHLSIPVLQTAEAEALSSTNSSLANLMPIAPQTQQIQWHSQALSLM